MERWRSGILRACVPVLVLHRNISTIALIISYGSLTGATRITTSETIPTVAETCVKMLASKK